MTIKKNPLVSFVQIKGVDYPKSDTFGPNELFPEFKKFKDRIILDKNNQIYGMLRENFKLLGLDKENYNEEKWNPFKGIIKPGDKVVIKPNAVLDINQKKGESVFASITHGAVIRIVIDYVFLALKGKGGVIVADAPLMHCNFENWINLTQMNNIKEFYKENFKFDIKTIDLRETYVPYSKWGYAPNELRELKQRDPLGYKEVNLGKLSKFEDLEEKEIKKFYGADYDRETTIRNHLKGNHKYKISGTILDADVIISIPKLKTHQKVGTTLNMKGMVGTQGDKNYIPHYRIGGYLEGGDEYPDQGFWQNSINKYRRFLITKVLKKKNKFYEGVFIVGNSFRFSVQKITDFFGRKIYKEKYIGAIVGGSWYGNDTAWRMAIDLTNIILYSDKEGNIKNSPQRKVISIVDGIISGEEEGPLAPKEKKTGCLIAGLDLVATDIVATRFMGFNPLKIKLYKHAIQTFYNNEKFLKKIKIKSNANLPLNLFNSRDKYLNFTSSKGWKGHIEI